MRPSGTSRRALAAVAAAPVILLLLWAGAGAGAGCSSGGAAGEGGAGGLGPGMPPAKVDPMDLISDFEEGRALVLPLGTPARGGSWYSYNDGAGTCLQSPAHGTVYYASTSSVPPPGVSRGRALHASWNACSTWGAGVGADFNRAVPDAGATTTAPRVPYDLSGYAGISFWAMAMPGNSTMVRAKVVMRISTQIEDGGACDESILGVDKCGDEWGEAFSLPGDGSWKQVMIRFSDAAFAQEKGLNGAIWGQPFPWNPADVLGIQFQSVAAGGLYDFWIDDVSLIR